MDELALHFFPFPHVYRGERREGALAEWPDRCSSCDRQCEVARPGQLGLCSYGLNYFRIDEDLLISGLVVRDFPEDTDARRKMVAKHRRSLVTRADVDRIVARSGKARAQIENELRARMDTLIAEWRETKAYQQEMVDLLRPDLEQALAQVHDYKQFVQQIVQNMNVVLESRFPGIPFAEKLEQATHEETAIYWAAVIMDEKLDAALFLESPDRIKEPREHARARLHGMVLKYLRIYKSRADRKRLTIAVRGESWGTIYGNQRALGIIPHTLIDNAIKYAPEGSHVQVSFDETQSGILLEVAGFGPKIEPHERQRIFDLFFRGEAAQKRVSEGTGFGLASAQNIARAHDTEIVVQQSDGKGPEDAYLTTFSVRFERASDPPVPRGRGVR